jgi:hypothetical protein
VGFLFGFILGTVLGLGSVSEPSICRSEKYDLEEGDSVVLSTPRIIIKADGRRIIWEPYSTD